MGRRKLDFGLGGGHVRLAQGSEKVIARRATYRRHGEVFFLGANEHFLVYYSRRPRKVAHLGMALAHGHRQTPLRQQKRRRLEKA